MAKKSKLSVVLQIELTQYGWTLKEDGASHGLFISKDKPMSLLKERQKALKADGRASDVIVSNQEDARGSKWRVRGTA